MNDGLLILMLCAVMIIVGYCIGLEQKNFIHPASTITNVDSQNDSLVKYTYGVKGMLGADHNQVFYDKSGKYKIGDTVGVAIKPLK